MLSHTTPVEVSECTASELNPSQFVPQVVIANRNVQRAEELAAAVGLNARAVGLAELGERCSLMALLHSRTAIMSLHYPPVVTCTGRPGSALQHLLARRIPLQTAVRLQCQHVFGIRSKLQGQSWLVSCLIAQ